MVPRLASTVLSAVCFHRHSLVFVVVADLICQSRTSAGMNAATPNSVSRNRVRTKMVRFARRSGCC